VATTLKATGLNHLNRFPLGLNESCDKVKLQQESVIKGQHEQEGLVTAIDGWAQGNTM
jgi:hypothetical protein